LTKISGWEQARKKLLKAGKDAPPKPLMTDIPSLVDWYSFTFDPVTVEFLDITHANPRLKMGTIIKRGVSKKHYFSGTGPCDICGNPEGLHEYDTLLVLKLTSTVPIFTLMDELGPVEEQMARDGINGFKYIETPEKFRTTMDEDIDYVG